jgi:diaminopimelate epimerase
MRTVPFVKASACGNDFLIVEAAHSPEDIHAFTRQLCDRHNGIGADGVEWVLPAQDADLALRLVNADGSDAEISGNGTRCVAAWYCAQHGRSSVVIRTDAGLKTCELVSRDGNAFQFRSSIGKPEIGGDTRVKVDHGEVCGTTVSMGNPHFVVFVSEFETDWQKVAEQIARHRDFKHGTNVEFVKVISQTEIEVRFYERGVGETMSSGTGSCAAAVASLHLAQVHSPVQVHAPGGVQTVEWSSEVFLIGPATLLFRGEFFV